MNDTMQRLQASDPARSIVAPEVDWDELYDEIVATAPRKPRPLWRRPTVTIPMFAVLSAGAVLLATAVAGSGSVTVDAREALAHPERVERELRDAGIDANVTAVPTKSMLVGKWFHLYLAPGSNLDDETFALLHSYVGQIDIRYKKVEARCPLGGCERTHLLELSLDVDVPITLVVGREPRPGEEYWAENIEWSNELAPHGALYCHALETMSAGEATETIEALGYDIAWVHERANSSDPVVAPPPDARIVSAWFRDTNTIDMRTALAGVADQYRVAAGTPSGTHPRSTVTWGTGCS